MEQLIQLVVLIIVFAIVAYGMKWVCANFSLPAPILWICGGILLVFLIIVAGRMARIGNYQLFPN